MRYFAPLDPDCPGAQEVLLQINILRCDPMTEAYGTPVDDIASDWVRKHSRICRRCQNYGAANIEVVD